MALTGSRLTDQDARNLLVNCFLAEQGGSRTSAYFNIEMKLRDALGDSPGTMAKANAQITWATYNSKTMNDFPSGVTNA